MRALLLVIARIILPERTSEHDIVPEHMSTEIETMPDPTVKRTLTRPFRILSVDGGGYLGLATAVFIQQMERHFSVSFSDRFDLFCGTSTGAIIAASLAVGKTGGEIVSLYKELGPKIFGTRKSMGVLRALYKLDDLKDCLQPHLKEVQLSRLLEKNKKVLITAFNRTTGKPRIFKTDHSGRLSTDNELFLLDVVLASASAPTYFPAAPIKNPATGLTEVFCDGGVACNHPALLGFTEATYELNILPSDIRLLSLSTPRQPLGEGKEALNNCDQGKWQWKDSIHNILIDSNSALVHETLRRLVTVFGDDRPRYVRINLENCDGLTIDDVSRDATESLVAIGSNAAIEQDARINVSLIIQG